MNISTPNNGRVLLGRQGEGLATKVVLDASNLKAIPGRLELVHQRSMDIDPYPTAITEVGDTVEWVVTLADTEYDGYGRLELRLYGDGGEVVKSMVYTTVVIRSLAEAKDPPEVWDGYIKRVEEQSNAAVTAAESAENAAKQSVESADAAASAAESAARSEKSTAELKQSAQSAAQSAQQSAEAARESAENAQKAAEDASRASSEALEKVDDLSEVVSQNKAAAEKMVEDEATARKDAIAELEKKIGNLSNIMNFRGAVNSVDDITDPTEGDVVAVIGTGKEYVYSNGSWVELGDTSTERKDITDLQERMDTAEGDIKTLKSGVEDLTVSDTEALEMLAECGVITPACASDGTVYTLNDKIVTI